MYLSNHQDREQASDPRYLPMKMAIARLRKC